MHERIGLRNVTEIETRIETGIRIGNTERETNTRRRRTGKKRKDEGRRGMRMVSIQRPIKINKLSACYDQEN